MIGFALVLGLLGSLHCLGMCGPLALAVPFPKDKRVVGIGAFNLGRIFTYALLGTLMGFIGSLFVLGGFQRIFSLTTGILILSLVIAPFLSKHLDKYIEKSSLIEGVRKKITEQFKEKTLRSSLILGMLNGLIPCGMVYTAMIGSISSGNPLNGALFMVLFGLGTWPAMIGIHGFRLFSFSSFNSRWVVPSVSLLIAVLFIYRGIGIQIPDVEEMLIRTGLNDITLCY